jgi:hypothetical protein
MIVAFVLSDNTPMFKLPLELSLAVFSHLNFEQLLIAQSVCRQWRQVTLDPSLWPSSVEVLVVDDGEVPCTDSPSEHVYETCPRFDRWWISWPDWVGKEKEYFKRHPRTISQVLYTFSKGSTKSVSVMFYENITQEGIFDVLPNFLSLEKLSLRIESISSHELISILQRLPQITSFDLHLDRFQGKPMEHLKTSQLIQLNLRTLHIHIFIGSRVPTHNTPAVAKVVEHSPDLVCLSVLGTSARKVWITKLGDRIQHLRLRIRGTLPPISCRGLKYLVLDGSYDQSREPFEPCPCDLSYLTHLSINAFSTEQQLSLMEAYNIGENLEVMHMDSNPGYAVFSRTPRLKSLSLARVFIDMPLHVCPELRTVKYTTLHSNLERNERARLQSQGYDVHSIFKGNLSLCNLCHQ